MTPVSAIDLFGTEEPVSEQRLLSAGSLTAVLEGGNLRYVRCNGVEVVRAINYLARDRDWGTLPFTTTNLVVTEDADEFLVRYDGHCGDDLNRLSFKMLMRGKSQGRLFLQAVATAETDFETNRTGFVILHPASVAGGRLSVTHTDGRVEETAFPLHVAADQPVFDIAALRHEPAPGVICTVALTGDAFEMEDQRNWTDASFKTYVRPLAKPRPYVIAKGHTDRQVVDIAISGAAEDTKTSCLENPPPPGQDAHPRDAFAGRNGSGLADLPIGASSRQDRLRVEHQMPAIALFADESVQGSDFSIAPMAANRIILRLDPHLDESAFAFAAQAAVAAGIEPCVEIVFDALDAEAEVRAVLARIADAQIKTDVLLATCRRDFKTRPSGILPEGEASVADLIGALRKGGFTGAVGAGTPSNFTEFNRNPPPPDCDFVYFAVSAIVHAADDASVVETLEAYPAVLESVRAMFPDKPLWLGPCTIAPRHNPYGSSTVSNPDGRRVTAAGRDPRHGALFGAAFAVGIADVASAAGVASLALAAPSGTFGLVGNGGAMHPLGHLVRSLTEASGSYRVEGIDVPHPCRSLAWVNHGLMQVLIANLSVSDADIRLRTGDRISMLGSRGWGEARPAESLDFRIAPYRTILVTSPHTG